MEAAAAAAAGSTSGILRFAGQSVEGLLVLRSLIAGVKDKDSPPPKSVRALAQSTTRLKDTFDEARDLFKRLRTLDGAVPGASSSSSAAPATGGGTAAPARVSEALPNRLVEELRPSFVSLEDHLRSCVAEIRLIVDGLRSQVADESGSFRQTWKQIEASRDRTFEEFAGTIATQEQTLQQALRKLSRQLDRLAQAKLEAISEKVEDSGSTADAREDESASSPSSTEVAAEDISSTRSEAADSAGATKATFTARKPSLSNYDRSCGANGTGRQQQQQQQQQQPRLPKYVYACEAVSGIDGAAEEREDGAIGCLYCARSFVHDDETTIHQLGTHIVRVHGFGLCNLNCTFENRIDLLRHLKSFHAWSRECDDETDAVMLDRYFLTPRRTSPRCSRLLDLEDGDVHAPRGMTEESEETSLLNLLVLNAILGVAKLDVKMDAPRPSSVTLDQGETELAHELCLALAQLDRLKNEARAKTGTSTSNTAATVEARDGEKELGGGGSRPAGLDDVEVDLDELVYHAACVQQELAVASGGEDVLRHEALYSADQYRIDDLVCMYFPPRASPDRHRAWYVRPSTTGPGAAAEVRSAIKRLGLARLEPAGPLRSFRDAVRLLGRAYMEQTGTKNYMAVMPQLLSASKVILRQDRQPPNAANSTAWVGGGQRRVRAPPVRSNTMPLLHQHLSSQSQLLQLQGQRQQPWELSADNLARLVQLQQRDAHVLADTTRERRLRWITDESLDWWFLGMLERSASFRRLVRSGKAFPAPSSKRSSKNPRPTQAESSTTGSPSVTADENKTRLAPYAWAAALLSSAGLPQSSGGRSNRLDVGRAAANGGGSGAGSHRYVPGATNVSRAFGSPSVAFVKAEQGSGSGSSPGSAERQPGRQSQQSTQQRQGQPPVQDKGKGKEKAVEQGLQRVLPNGTRAEEAGENEEHENDEDRDSSDGESWDSASSD